MSFELPPLSVEIPNLSKTNDFLLFIFFNFLFLFERFVYCLLFVYWYRGITKPGRYIHTYIHSQEAAKCLLSWAVAAVAGVDSYSSWQPIRTDVRFQARIV